MVLKVEILLLALAVIVQAYSYFDECNQQYTFIHSIVSLVRCTLFLQKRNNSTIKTIKANVLFIQGIIKEKSHRTMRKDEFFLKTTKNKQHIFDNKVGTSRF